MKKTLLTISLLATTFTLWANPISQRQAQQLAHQFFSSHGVTMSAKAKAFHAPQQGGTTTTTSPYYVFNAGDDKGFAIISGDDRTEPVLGYSLSGSLSDNDMPDNLRSFLQSYAEQIEYIQKHNISIKKAPSTERAHIDPMLTTKWNQTTPYNNSCPTDYYRQRSVTGCVATAMAQVLYYQYQQHPSTIANAIQATIPSYKTQWTSGNITVPAINAGSQIDWANMLPTYSGNSTSSSETAVQKTAVANLMYYCGAAVKMNYSSNASSASDTDVPEALINYFGFDKSTQLVSRDASYTTKAWNDLVYNELTNNRVVFYGGQSASGSGHAFVINGYDQNNFFYVNWGWGGIGDGAYLLSILSPTGTGTGAGTVDDGYNQDQDIVINAEPNHNGTALLRVKAINYSQNGNTLSYYPQNVGSETISFNYGYGIVGSNGSITLINGTSSTVNNLRQNYYIQNAKTLNLASLGNGTFDVVPVAKLTTSSAWQSLWPAGHSINVTVNNRRVTINNGDDTPSLSASALTTSGADKAGRTTTIKTTLTNTGTGDFEGQLYLFASTTSSKDTAVATPSAGVMAGGTADLSIDWTPTAAGTYTLWLCSDEAGNNVLATANNIVIAEGNGQYAMTLVSMTVNGEDPSSVTYDSEGRTVTNVSGNDLVGSYTLQANQTISAGTNFVTFVEKLNETTGAYEDYNSSAYPSGMGISYYNSNLSSGASASIDFSFSDFPNGSYIIRPEVGTLQASYYYYMSPELWYDDSHVYVLGAKTGIASVKKGVNDKELVTVYNLQGMKVATLSADKLSTLPHGIYIMNGRKFMVK